MFDNLDEQIANAEARNSTQTERVIRHLVVAIVSVVLFGGLFLGVWLLEY
jgi:cell division septal protein FtsQ